MVKIDQLEVPSGAIYRSDDLSLLRTGDKHGLIRYSPDGFTLKSGVRSHVYVYGRNDVTDNPELAWLIGNKTAEVVIENYRDGDKDPCLIGIPTAGNAIAAAGSFVAYAESMESPGGPISFRIMRETLKQHGSGANQWVNGAHDDLHTFWGVENVVTDGGTKLEAAPKLIESGYPAYEMPWLIFVDRQQGGIPRMEQAGFKRIVVAYRLLDITFAMGELGLWPKDLVTDVEREIREHQFAA